MIVDLSDRYVIISNRERGQNELCSFGRYDILLKPVDKESGYAYIIEFKVHKPRKEKDLEETLANVHTQIEEKHYETELVKKGFLLKRIRKYGFAFQERNA